jgi:hypothetical protein
LFCSGAPKRAAWDYKGRMEDMEQYLSTMKTTQQNSIQRIEMLESQKHQLQGNVVMKEKEMEEVIKRKFAVGFYVYKIR